VTRVTAPCGSPTDPEQGSVPLLLCHCAEHICEAKSYTWSPKAGRLKIGPVVAIEVCVGFKEGAGVLVGAEITFT